MVYTSSGFFQHSPHATNASWWMWSRKSILSLTNNASAPEKKRTGYRSSEVLVKNINWSKRQLPRWQGSTSHPRIPVLPLDSWIICALQCANSAQGQLKDLLPCRSGDAPLQVLLAQHVHPRGWAYLTKPLNFQISELHMASHLF